MKSDLRQAGFVECRKRGKGSHTRWVHPDFPEVVVTMSGNDGDDVQQYQEDQVREAIRRVQEET